MWTAFYVRPTARFNKVSSADTRRPAGWSPFASSHGSETSVTRFESSANLDPGFRFSVRQSGKLEVDAATARTTLQSGTLPPEPGFRDTMQGLRQY